MLEKSNEAPEQSAAEAGPARCLHCGVWASLPTYSLEVQLCVRTHLLFIYLLDYEY